MGALGLKLSLFSDFDDIATFFSESSTLSDTRGEGEGTKHLENNESRAIRVCICADQ